MFKYNVGSNRRCRLEKIFPINFIIAIPLTNNIPVSGLGAGIT
jgi:hypothetical protein